MNALWSFRIAYRHVRLGLGRLVLSTAALALGVGMVVATQLMNGAILASFSDTIDGMVGRAALTISADEGVTFDEEFVSEIAKIDGVALAVPLVTSVAFPDDASGELLSVHGVDVANESAVRVYHRGDTSKLIDDTIEFLNSRRSIVVGREFADRRHLTVGSEIPLVTPTGVQVFVIRGLLDAEGLAKTLGGRLVVMDLYAAELSFTKRGQINQIDLLVAPDDEMSVKQRVEAMLPVGLKVEEPSLRKSIVRRSVGGFQAMLNAFALLGVIAGFVICYGRLSAVFETRVWEVGLLRAVGLNRTAVSLELLKESLLIGIPGAAAGVGLGWLVGTRGLPVVARTMALNFRLPVPEVAAGLTVHCVLVGITVGLGAAILAAALPALRLSRRQPISALTMRGRETIVADSTGAIYAGGAALVVGVLILTQRLTGLAILGTATLVMLAVLACLCARPLLKIGTVFLMAAWHTVFGPVGTFAVIQIRQRSRSASLTVGTLGIGLGAVIMFGILAWSFESTLVSVLRARMRADLVINSAFTSAGYVGSPITDGITGEIRGVAGVTAVAGEQQRDVRYYDESIVLDAYDPPCFLDDRLCHWALLPGAPADSAAIVARGDAALVSTSFAHRYGTQPGDQLRLETPKGPLELRVAGITNGQPASSIILSRELYRAFWNDTLLSWIHVAIDPGSDVNATKARVQTQLGQTYRLNVRSGPEIIEYFADQARSAFRFVYVMEIVIGLLLLVAIGDTLAATILERIRTFGMMRAVGLRRAHLFGIVLLESGTIGFLGSILAVGTGLALGVFWVQVQFPALLGWSLDLHVPYGFIAMAVSAAIFLCLAAAVVPSLRAAGVTPVRALRAE